MLRRVLYQSSVRQITEVDLTLAETRSRPVGDESIPQQLVRTILILTSSGTDIDGIASLLAASIPGVVVLKINDLGAACRAFEFPVGLIIIDFKLLRAAETASLRLSSFHPDAMVALLEPRDQSPDSFVPKVFASRLVRSVLPANLKAGIMISIVRFMLSGGEYFSSKLLRYYVKKAALGSSEGMQDRQFGESAFSRPMQVSDLTRRELEILELVSRGMQNKMIATQFSLSEHTVKIHLHNIISKLGTSNRTEAAARFRDYKAAAD
ncbi:response regulator transcription factor [Tianweitania sp. Rool2]|uniref:Response regulator transcription factor n=1 Tax=Oryzicola mucosus TaxID=2767425 RepID=A0A8J6PU43_9HYPH|nr:response regulator transcription factor [Oryzicola mucosus]